MDERPELPPFPLEGVKLKVFLDFIEEMGGRQVFYKTVFEKEKSRSWGFCPCFSRSVLKAKEVPLTTTDVCNMFLKELTAAKAQSYVEYLTERNSPDVGMATAFIFHAWKYNFLDVVDALQYHFSSEPDVYIWFDLFSNNQHKTSSLPFKWWSETFLNAIGKLGRVVMVLSPWNNPIPFTRAWCLWEIYCAVETKSKFEVAITPEQYDAFVEGITSDYTQFYKMLANINVENSESFNPDDKTRIFNAVEIIDGGFSALNSMVIGKMRDWVLVAIDRSIEESKLKIQTQRESVDLGETVGSSSTIELSQESKDEIKKSRLVIWKRLLAKMSMMKDMGMFKKALEIGEKCLVEFADVDDELKFAQTYNNLGNVYDSLGEYKQAIESHEKSLQIRK